MDSLDEPAYSLPLTVVIGSEEEAQLLRLLSQILDDDEWSKVVSIIQPHVGTIRISVLGLSSVGESIAGILGLETVGDLALYGRTRLEQPPSHVHITTLQAIERRLEKFGVTLSP